MKLNLLNFIHNPSDHLDFPKYNGFEYHSVKKDDALFDDRFDPACTAAIVHHPYWAVHVNKFNPYAVISCISESLHKQEDAFINFYMAALFSNSTVILAENEETYLDLCLLYPNVLCINENQSSSSDSLFSEKENVVLQIMKCLAEDNPTETLKTLHGKRLRKRLEEIKDYVEWDPNHQERLLILAKYLYLNGDYSEAEYYFYQSFSRSTAFGKPESLSAHYPWITLVQARQGKIKHALNSFGILALSADQNQCYHQLLNRFDTDDQDLIKAEISIELGDRKPPIIRQTL
ncbi:hypothetical protein ABFG93_16290 [Pseudalkalibacillus hwajinpoensis]|uniref:hypothetical protein n=1 Tax=Guptibacillus hwajinpoensis TaxID=208199 RepID=UPI00325A4556